MSQTVYSKRQFASSIYSSLNIDSPVVKILMAIVTGLIMLFYLVFLTSYPAIFIDEAWISNAAWNWITTGLNFDTMHTGVLDQFGAPWLSRPFLGEAPLAISFWFFGLGFFQARLASWTMGCLLLIAVIWVGKVNYSTTTGLLAALILSLSSPFLLSSHYARQDIMLALFIMVAYGVAIWNFNANKWWGHLLAGFLIGVGTDIHQNAALFIPGLAALYLICYGKTILKQQGTWLCGLGGLAGIFVFAAIHILPNPQAYMSFYGTDFSDSGSHALPILSFNPIVLVKSLRGEFSRYHFFDNSLEFSLIGASLIYLIMRFSNIDRYLLVFLTITALIFILIVNNKSEYYGILLYPFLMLIVAEAFVSLIRYGKKENRLVFGFASALLVLYGATSFIHVTRHILSNQAYNYNTIVEQIKPVVPANARVTGLPQWWLGLSDYDYRATTGISYYKMFNGLTARESLEKIKPDILIIDGELRSILVDETNAATAPGSPAFHISRKEFEQFLNEQGTIILEFDNQWHGKIEVYQIDWNL